MWEIPANLKTVRGKGANSFAVSCYAKCKRSISKDDELKSNLTSIYNLFLLLGVVGTSQVSKKYSMRESEVVL